MDTQNEEWMTLALLRYHRTKVVVDSFHTYKIEPWMADKEQIQALELLPPTPAMKVMETAIHAIRLMQLRARFNDCIAGGLLSFRTETKLTREDLELLARSWTEEELLDKCRLARYRSTDS